MNSHTPHPQRIGVLGTGSSMVPTIQQIANDATCELVVVCGNEDERLRNLAGVRFTDDYERVVTARSLDALYFGPTHKNKVELVDLALRSGKHVLVEQPVSYSVTDANHLAELARSLGSVFMASRAQLFSESVAATKRVLQNGSLGDMMAFTCVALSSHSTTSDGTLWTLGPNQIATALYWLDELPISAEATATINPSGMRDEIIFITLQFASGIIGQFQLATGMPVEQHDFSLTGTKAIANCSLSPSQQITLLSKDDLGNTSAYIPGIAQTDPHQLHWAHFLDCVRYAKKPRSSGRSEVWVIAIMEAIERSLHTGRREVIDYPRPRAAVRTDRFRAQQEVDA